MHMNNVTIVLKQFFTLQIFQAFDGTDFNLTAIICDSPVRFLKDFLRLKHGSAYLNRNIIDSHCGPRTTRMASPDGHVLEMKRKLLLLITVFPSLLNFSMLFPIPLLKCVFLTYTSYCPYIGFPYCQIAVGRIR